MGYEDPEVGTAQTIFSIFNNSFLDAFLNLLVVYYLKIDRGPDLVGPLCRTFSR